MNGSEAAAPVVRTVDAGRGVAWWSEAWALFTKAPGMWIAMALIMIIIFIVLGLIPVVGGLATALLAPVFAGGWILAARKVEDGGALEIGDLFGGFKDKLSPLVVLGAAALVATLVIGVIGGLLGFGAVFGMMAGGAHHSGAGVLAGLGAGMLVILVILAFSLLVTMALWFAPALVVLRNVAPLDAMKMSFAANLQNIVPFLIYGVLYIIAAIVASIPFGLGWIVLAPVLMLSVYVSYKDIFQG
jgi:hypothetical protein